MTVQLLQPALDAGGPILDGDPEGGLSVQVADRAERIDGEPAVRPVQDVLRLKVGVQHMPDGGGAQQHVEDSFGVLDGFGGGDITRIAGVGETRSGPLQPHFDDLGHVLERGRRGWIGAMVAADPMPAHDPRGGGRPAEPCGSVRKATVRVIREQSGREAFER